jgi:prepilin-type N-terminal cleavage/methylation domain-containing protein
MKEQKINRIGFTLIEMLVVIAIIALIAALVFPAINSALMKGKQTKCISQLRGFAQIWNMRYMELNPSSPLESDRIYPWLSSMYPHDMGTKNFFICPSDPSNGADGGKPDAADFVTIDPNDFPETDDNDNNPASGQHAARNPDVERNSYMYEFCDATISWGWNGYVKGPGNTFIDANTVDEDKDGRITWGEVKLYQLKYGDTFSQGEYPAGRFPVIRCFHHYKSRRVVVQNMDNPGSPTRESSIRVLNAAVGGNVFISGMQWEYPLAD